MLAHLEAFPHLVERLSALWGTRELNIFIQRLLLDCRDGARQGLPVQAAEELLFIGKLNRLVRAQESAEVLSISLGEALELTDRGDRAAALDPVGAQDPWGGAKHMRNRASALRSQLRPHHAGDAGVTRRVRPQGTALPTFRLHEAPPLPDCLRIDVTTPRPLRGNTDDGLGEATMDWGFFRCLVREASALGIAELEIADLGVAESWPWLSAALRFCRQQCRFTRITLHADLLGADIGVLAQAIDAGVDQIVIEFNMASGRWRTRAMQVLALAPDSLESALRRLVEYRDGAAQAGRSCVIAIGRSGQHHSALLQKALRACLAQSGVVRYVPSHPGIASVGHSGVPRNLHCWAPFTTAHVRTNGHLVACAQDHSGYSYMADLKTLKLAEAWSGQAFRRTRQRVLCGERPGRQCDICAHRAQGKARSAPPTV